MALFWKKLNKMCKFFITYELGVFKLAKYVRNCFLEKFTQLTKILLDCRLRQIPRVRKGTFQSCKDSCHPAMIFLLFGQYRCSTFSAALTRALKSGIRFSHPNHLITSVYNQEIDDPTHCRICFTFSNTVFRSKFINQIKSA